MYVLKFLNSLLNYASDTAQMMKFSMKDFLGKCDLIRWKLQVWSHLLNKSLMENFIFKAVSLDVLNYVHLITQNNINVTKILSELPLCSEICSPTNNNDVLLKKVSSHVYKCYSISCNFKICQKTIHFSFDTTLEWTKKISLQFPRQLAKKKVLTWAAGNFFCPFKLYLVSLVT